MLSACSHTQAADRYVRTHEVQVLNRDGPPYRAPDISAATLKKPHKRKRQEQKNAEDADDEKQEEQEQEEEKEEEEKEEEMAAEAEEEEEPLQSSNASRDKMIGGGEERQQESQTSLSSPHQPLESVPQPSSLSSSQDYVVSSQSSRSSRGRKRRKLDGGPPPQVPLRPMEQWYRFDSVEYQDVRVPRMTDAIAIFIASLLQFDRSVCVFVRVFVCQYAYCISLLVCRS